MAVDGSAALVALGALAQEHRLALFRLLLPGGGGGTAAGALRRPLSPLRARAGGEGMAAGAIAEALGVPNSSLSFHLAQLSRAGLIRQKRQHRSLIYRANYTAMNG